MTNAAKYRVLYVEDSELGAALGSSLLEEAGFEYEVAKNGKIALDLLNETNFDLVLMDIEMPVMDGITAVQRLRSGNGNAVPVIALTGHDSPEERKRCFDAGMNACLSKPIDRDSLLAAIHDQLGIQSAAIGNRKPVAEKKNDSFIDLSYLETISKGNRKFYFSMIDLFLLQVPLDVKELGEAVRTGNFEMINLLSHKIKTSVVFVGLDAHIHAQLVEMESLGKQGTGAERIKELFTLVDHACTLACNELVAYRAENKL